MTQREADCDHEAVAKEDVQNTATMRVFNTIVLESLVINCSSN